MLLLLFFFSSFLFAAQCVAAAVVVVTVYRPAIYQSVVIPFSFSFRVKSVGSFIGIGIIFLEMDGTFKKWFGLSLRVTHTGSKSNKGQWLGKIGHLDNVWGKEINRWSVLMIVKNASFLVM